MEQDKNNIDILIPSQVREPLFWKGYFAGALAGVLVLLGAPQSLYSVIQNIF